MAYDIVDFGWLGDLPKQFRDERRRATRERTLADLGRGGDLDYGRAATALLAAGDTEGGVSLARLAEARSHRATDTAWRREEAERAQRNADRSYGLHQRQLDATIEGERIPPGFRRGPDGTLMFIPGGPADPSYRRSVGDRRNPNATAGHAIDPPAAGANVSGFAEPTTLITGLIGDRVMARALSAPATAAPLARWSRAYSALARQPSARSMAGFEMASRNLANTMSARLGTSFTPADILRAMQGPVQAPAEEE